MTQLRRAMQIIREELFGGPMACGTVINAGRIAGIGNHTMMAAARRLHILREHGRVSRINTSLWSLPQWTPRGFIDHQAAVHQIWADRIRTRRMAW